MADRYTMHDVLRWQQVDEGRLPMKRSQLHDPKFAGRRDFALSGLHLLHEGLGYTYVALGDRDKATDHFRDSCRFVGQIFTLPQAGETVAPGRLSAGYCMSWLVALAIRESAMAADLALLFDPQQHSASSSESAQVIAISLQHLLAGRKDDALAALTAPRAEMSDEFQYMDRCLAAIASLDEPEILCSLRCASAAWASRVERSHKGLPQAVCFIHGLGLLRLAELVLGKRLDIDSEVIPAHFFA